MEHVMNTVAPKLYTVLDSLVPSPNRLAMAAAAAHTADVSSPKAAAGVGIQSFCGRTPSLTTSELAAVAEEPAAERQVDSAGDAPDVSLEVAPEPEQGSPEPTRQDVKKVKRANKRMTMSAIIAGSFINDEVGDTSSDEEEEEAEEEVGWAMLVLPLIHFGWYIAILAVSVNFLNLWLAVYQGGAGVRERIEHLVEDVVFLHHDVQGEIFSPEGFVRWVAERLLPFLSPPPEQCYPGICSSLSDPAMLAQYSMPAAPDVPVWLEDDFNAKNTSIWAFASVATEFCASFLLAAPSGVLL